ncbi:MAG: transcriptional regulator [Deltaproteobacteria bacterium]|nr:MAG: transcriptional regulator [Deltaproteobacteria bacterium]
MNDAADRDSATASSQLSAPVDNGVCKVSRVDAQRVRRARAAMLPDEVVRDVADTFKVLAHPTRIRIVRALATEELCVCDLAALIGLSISATSHQLQAMRKIKLVRHRMDGKLAYYSLRDPFVLALLEDGVRHVTDGEAPG